jgi:cystathionine beta-lyase
VSHGIFGYTEANQDYYDVLASWFSSRFGYNFSRCDVVKTPGVVFALAMCVRAFTEPEDSVLIQTPVYYPFYEIIRENGRKLITNPLVYKSGAYSIDFEDFERKVAENRVKLFILCSPHNPVGRVWTNGELAELHRICKDNGVTVVSDEIHCDFVYTPHKHTCYGLIDEDAVIATAPSKTFNLAGLQTANIIVRNAGSRRKLTSEMNGAGYSQLNTLGLAACQSAYANGGEWLEALKTYLEGNIHFVKNYLARNLPKIRLVEPQGTYLLWLDFSGYGLTQTELDGKIIEDAGLWLDSGTMFGAEGDGFQRVNIACPRPLLEQALSALGKAFQNCADK